MSPVRSLAELCLNMPHQRQGGRGDNCFQQFFSTTDVTSRQADTPAIACSRLPDSGRAKMLERALSWVTRLINKLSNRQQGLKASIHTTSTHPYVYFCIVQCTVFLLARVSPRRVYMERDTFLFNPWIRKRCSDVLYLESFNGTLKPICRLEMDFFNGDTPFTAYLY